MKEYMTRQIEEGRSYSRAVKARGGTTVYLAGVGGIRDRDGSPLPAADFSTEARRALERLRDAVGLAGGTLDDIVTMTVFITDCRYGDEFVKIRSEYFKPGRYPASALITVAALARPEMQIEIQAVAVLEDRVA